MHYPVDLPAPATDVGATSFDHLREADIRQGCDLPPDLEQLASALATAAPPKQRHSARSATYRYYAGFSERFVEDLLSAVLEPTNTVILDPWMGSGTTVRIAHKLGFNSVGIDLNPAMIVIAKARLLCVGQSEQVSLAVAKHLGTTQPHFAIDNEEPLLVWFDAETAATLRGLVSCILSPDSRIDRAPDSCSTVESLSSVDAHLLVAVFLVVRRLIASFVGSNPTWVKVPASPACRVSATWEDIRVAVQVASDQLRKDALPAPRASSLHARLQAASSLALPQSAYQATCAISSPPYCTRIDYAVATRPELAVLGLASDVQANLRRQLLGTTTVPPEVVLTAVDIGDEATRLLRAVSRHQTKASATYYCKWLGQYFHALAVSLDQLSDLPQLGVMALVLQDSHYKDLRIDLPHITTEMLEARGWTLVAHRDFDLPLTKAAIHPWTKKYRSNFSAAETVLLLGRLNSPKGLAP